MRLLFFPIISLVSLAFRIANLAVWAYVILSWIVQPYTKLYEVYRILARYIEPVLAPIRKLISPLTYKIGLDFSPYILVLLISWVGNFVIRLLYFIF